MRYVQPYGMSDPNAPYVNGDPSIARQGSIPPAEAFEHPMREIVNVIQKNQITPSSADLAQMLQATRSQRVNFVEDTGSINNISVAFDPPLTKYTLGFPIRVRMHATNDGGVSIDAGAGRVPVKRTDGGNMQPGDMPQGGICELAFDGTAFQMINFLGLGGGGTGGDVINNYSNLPYTVDVSTTPSIITANFSPAIVTLNAGTAFLVKIANTNIADTVINVNAILNKSVRVNSGDRLLPGDVAVGDIKLFVYDGTNFYIDPNTVIPNDVTINVPSTQFPTMAATLAALGRKTISQAATLKIKMGIGTFPGVVLSHPNAGRMIIEGTMKAAAPGRGEFATYGGNANMLLSRYGSVIQPGSGGIGFWNQGPGCPLLKDVMIYGGTGGIFIDVSFPIGQSMETQNVAICGCASWGIYTAGKIRMAYGCIDECGSGMCGVSGADCHAAGTYFIANGYAGVMVSIGSCCTLQSCYSDGNGIVGVYAGSNSMASVQGTAVSYNGYYDCYSAFNSTCWLTGSGSATNSFSPPLQSAGNYNGLMFAQ